MIRKLISVLGIVILSFGLAACGAGNAGSESVSMIEKEITELEDTKDTSDAADMKMSGEYDIEDIEADTAEEVDLGVQAEEQTEEINEMSWYMDEEGVKSDLLGIVIKKDDSALRWLGLSESVFADGYKRVFCEYYEGDIDTYMEEHQFRMAGSGFFEDICYAYDDREIVFVGNDVVITIDIAGCDITDMDAYLEELSLIKPYEEPKADCLAYLTSQGLYCPALGVKLECDGRKVTRAANFGVSADWKNLDVRRLSIYDESVTDIGISYYMVDAPNAQAVVDKFTEEAEQGGWGDANVQIESIEGTEEEQVGKYKYLGRGYIAKTKYASPDHEVRLFYSDESTWSIEIVNEIGGNYKDCLSILEPLN